MGAKIMRRSSQLLLAAQAFFLWMFLAAEPLEQLADAGFVSGTAQSGDIHAATYLFAARWRHGMTEGWPLYMPGFFAVAITVWFWSLGLTTREIFSEGTSIVALALIAAVVLQPIGTKLILDEFEHQTGLKSLADAPPNTLLGIFRSVYTMLTFVAGIICIQRAIALKRIQLLIVPIVMNLILAMIRPWTVGDFTSYWFRGAMNGELVASLSCLAVAMTLGAMFWSQWITLSRCRAESAALSAGVHRGRETSMSE